MTHIYIVRHGESEGNRDRIFQGCNDLPLTKKGITQGKTLREYFKDIPLCEVFSSDLSRAYDTAKYIGNTVLTDLRLREIDAGVWQGKNVDDIKSEYPEKWREWTSDRDNFTAIEGESIKAAKRRMVDFFREIGEKYSGKSVAAVTHGAVLKAFLSEISDRPIDEVSLPGNCSVSLITYDGGVFRIVFSDDRHHLGENEKYTRTDFA